ncbi:histone-lysine N-methyltransferase ASHR1-like isoform X2 [Agrilus planipennis]|uniref:Histone-lysine N-methyltransferase ASHR1-like isoform X2 n=1 Tax=Agrilus planipennis TaxID=224129 RepID=A0A1W4WZX5_AGRPL|nr:histone-lysine N-methyltransferase ASHR1-like isoform X2 [Agrilus planipennis]
MENLSVFFRNHIISGKTDHFDEYVTFKKFFLANSETKERGRHVITEKKLNVGDVLFIEKAFSFAPILLDESDTEIKLSKCFYCLSDALKVCIPCLSCTKVIYCNKKCRSESWKECHQWECLGMQTNFWQEIGVGFPAFRAFLKGLSSHFERLPSNYDFEMCPFGDETNNYRFFNALVTNFCHMENITKILIIATAIVCYLEKYTDFYVFNYSKLNYEKKEDLVIESGAHLCKHIAQFICNANVIHHLSSNFLNNPEMPFNVIPVACGIFPSISIMNHSCKPNISLYFEKDVAIVKAVETVEAGGEIFNCYGANYLFYNKLERQEKCEGVYHFTCDCIICSNPHLEIENYDTFSCKNCGGQLLKTSPDYNFKCVNCSQASKLVHVGEIEEKVSELYSKPNPSEKYLLACLKRLNDDLYPKHSCFVHIYAILTEYYTEKGDIKELFKYSKLLCDTEKSRLGDYNMQVGIKLKTLIKCIHSCLEKKEFGDIQQYRKEIEDLSQMVDDMKKILGLYFHLGNHHFEKIEFAVGALRFVLQISLKNQ